MKRTILLFALCLITLCAFSQETETDKHTRKVNYGIKGGFNSSMYFIQEFKIKDVRINEIQNNYQVGYLGTIFLRINMNRHFIQPELAYQVSKGEISFDKKGSQHPDIEPDYASISSTIHTFELPILYGYNFIKSGPYGMCFFAGPKIKYIWKEKSKLEFHNFDQKNITEELYPLNVNLVVGLGVNISNVFFDFRYEIGLHNISKSATYIGTNENGAEELSTIVLNRKSNVLSFTLGVIF